ncbi:MAG: ribosome-associated translation inhibitor RaiA [Spirochaetes bacterium]|nr:ribosome-associated translation inhibitor RaiA [Spirochaetota bacterium]
MKIKITGRHIDVSDALRDYAEKKISRLEKYFQQLIDTHLILYIEKLDHTAELVMNGDSVQFHARDKAADLYSAIDLLTDKMDVQISRFKEKIQTRKGHGVAEELSFDIISDKGKEALLNQVSNKPFDKIEAFLQMKLNRKDYILFKRGVAEVDGGLDFANKNYAVIYRSGQGYRMAEVPVENFTRQEPDYGSFNEYELEVIDESPANPKINFKKADAVKVGKLTLDEALDTMEKSGSEYMAFFNTDTRYFNVLSKNGKKYEVLVPAF